MSEPWFPDRRLSRAVLIGTSTFDAPALPDLPAVARNLQALRQVLTDTRHGVIGTCTVLADKDVTDTKVGAALTAAAREATDLLLVYYAGHGVLDEDGRLYLARPDTSPDHVGWTSVSLELLKRDLGRAIAGARVLILDCCFSGRAITAMADPSSLAAGQLHLSGTYTLTSTTATMPSHAPPGKRYTSFTNALLGALAQPAPLTLNDIYRRIDAELAGLGLPRPQHNATNAAATLALTHGPVLPVTEPPPHRAQATTVKAKPASFAARRPWSLWLTALWASGWLSVIGIVSWIIGQAVLPPDERANGGAAAIALLAIVLVAPGIRILAEGRFAIGDDQLTLRLPFGLPERIAWHRIHTIRVLGSTRSDQTGPRCVAEIQLTQSHDYLPGGVCLSVPGQERPTYRFAEIKATADQLATALRYHLRQRNPPIIVSHDSLDHHA